MPELPLPTWEISSTIGYALQAWDIAQGEYNFLSIIIGILLGIMLLGVLLSIVRQPTSE